MMEKLAYKIKAGIAENPAIANFLFFVKYLPKRGKKIYTKLTSDYFDHNELTQEFLLNILNKMELWREKYNGNEYGLGRDPYYPSQKLKYPMAYAFYQRGYVELYKYTGKSEWMEKASDVADKLEQLKMVFEDAWAWGLPIIWQGRKNEPYTITTALVGHAYMDFYEIKDDEKILEIVDKIVSWALNKLGKTSFNNNSSCFWYSPEDKEEVLNACAEIMGVMARRYGSGRKDLKDIVMNTFNYIMKRRLPEGDWAYHGEKPYSALNGRDFHTGWVIEGNYYVIVNEVVYKKLADEAVVKPYKTYLQAMINKNGSLKRTDIYDPVESTMMGYGASLYPAVFALELSNDEKFDKEISHLVKRVLNYLFSNLYDFDKGVFKYRYTEPEIDYIRQEATIFYTLAKLLNSQKFWNLIS